MHKKVYIFLSLLVFASMLLAACGGGAATQPAPAAPAQTQAPAAPAAFECKDKIGCLNIAPTDPIHLAAAMVIAGPNETLGLDSLYGAEIAVADKGGKLLGHDIKLTSEDTGCSAEGGQAAATKLAADPTIAALIGTSCSSEARVAMPLFSKAGFTMMSASNTAPDLTTQEFHDANPGYARTAHNDLYQGASAAKFAWEKLGVKKAATIHDGSLYADKLQQVFAEEFKKLGGTITSQEAIDPNQTDMGPVLTRIASSGAEMIYLPIFLPAGPLIIQQAKQTTGLEKTYLMGADGLFSPDVTKAAGDAVEGFFVSSPFMSGKPYEDFLVKYKAKVGKEPLSIFHAHAYDAANILMGCIEKIAVKDADGTVHIGRQDLRDCVYATKDYQGLTGTLTCSPTGDCGNPVIAVYQYHKGEYPPKVFWP